MNKIAFLCPIYPPHFKFARDLLDSLIKNSLCADLWFIFTNENEKSEFGDYGNSIVLPEALRNFKNRGIINIKKFYGLKEIQNKYNYIITIDAEQEFIKNIDIGAMCESYYKKKILLGNKISQQSPKELKIILNKVKKHTFQYFAAYKNSETLKNDLWLWFNQPCIYNTLFLDDFFEKINYKNNIKTLKWEDFDYYLFMNYLILFKGFTPVDIGIKAWCGTFESDSLEKLEIENDIYKNYEIYQCTPALLEKFDNPGLFLLVHKDRGKYKKISSRDISVVVQGGIVKETTRECLFSIRKFLPKAQIILSTWKGSNVDGLDYDVLLLNDDPGAVKSDYFCNYTNNCNRQLLSTQAGIRLATQKYILKLRTDLVLKNSDFLLYWDNFKKRSKNYVLFDHRVICSCIYSREVSDQGGSGYPTPFLVSDFWFFGLSKDIASYFLDYQLLNNEELGNWKFKYPNKLPYPTPLWRYAPEQYFCTSWVRKYFPNLQFEDWSDWGTENIELSNHILYNNFIFLGYEQSGIYSKKHAFAESSKNSIQGLITYQTFEKRYITYCDKTYQPGKSAENATPNKDYKLRLKVHYHRLISPLKRLISWAGELLSVLFYACAVLFSNLKKEQKK